MLLEILTPDQKVYSGDVTSVKLPGKNGNFEVLTNHAPMISTLDKGVVNILVGNKVESILIDGGMVEVLNNHVIVLAESVTVS